MVLLIPHVRPVSSPVDSNTLSAVKQPTCYPVLNITYQSIVCELTEKSLMCYSVKGLLKVQYKYIYLTLDVKRPGDALNRVDEL